MSKKRLSWECYFLEIAKTVSLRSTCPRASVGAIVVKDNRILATGYNGAPENAEHCVDVGCLIQNNFDTNGFIVHNCERVIHAEMNAIGFAARYGVGLKDSVVYIYDSKNRERPCQNCWKVLNAAGIHKAIILGSDRKIRYYEIGAIYA